MSDWRVLNILDTAICLEALEDSVPRFGASGVLDDDRSSPYLSEAIPRLRHDHCVAISMDGTSPWVDNLVLGQPWRSFEFEIACLNGYGVPNELRAKQMRYVESYKGRRRHSSLSRKRWTAT